MSVLSIVEQAYRGTVEEQDDTILWLSHMLKNAGADLNILLRSNAVNYAVKGQDASGLTIGGVPLTVPPTIDKDVEALIAAGVTVYAVLEDLEDLGVPRGELIGGIQTVARSGVAGLFDKHDTVWYW
jgi:intracellular sulfur oxidation DsrE/DsrF family protein